MLSPMGDQGQAGIRRFGKSSIQDIYGKKTAYTRQAGSFLKISPSINGAPKSYHNLRIRQQRMSFQQTVKTPLQ